MSFSLPPVNLSGAVVGTPIPVPFIQLIATGSPLGDLNGSKPSMMLKNESGVGLDLNFPQSGLRFPLGAGYCTNPFPLSPNETSFTATPLYILANQPVSKLLGAYYLPGEQPVSMQALGNSPIGLRAVTLPVTQVIQDGQPTGQVIVEATPSGSGQNVLITTDGACDMVSYNILPGVGGSLAKIDFETPYVVFRPPESGATALGFAFQTWTGSANPLPLTIGGAVTGLASVDNSGNIATTVNVTASGNLNWGAGISGNRSFVSWSNVNHENEYWAPQSGATHQGHIFVAWNGVGQVNAFSIGNTGVVANAAIGEGGNIATVGGQATVGSFGVPPIVASTPQAGVAVSATTQQTIIASTSVPVGLYRIAGAVNLNNGTSGQHINFTLHGPGATGANMWTFTSSTTLVAMDGSTDTLTNGLWNCLVQSFAVVAAGNISVTYQDPGGTPNDTVWCVIEKLC